MQKKQVAVIEIGSSKITVAVGEPGVNKTFLIKYRKDYEYEGFSDGEFFDAESVKKIMHSCADFIEDAVGKGGAKGVYVGVPGEFTAINVKSGQISFSGKKRITEEDVDRLFESAFAITAYGYSLINRSAIVYELDDYRRLANPLGVASEILKGKLSFVMCSDYFTENVKNPLKAAGLDNVELVSESLAEIMFLLEPETRDRIAILLDVGYITTTFSLVQGDGILYQKSFGFGGGYLTGALSQRFECDFAVAEELKKKINLCGAEGSERAILLSDGKYYSEQDAKKTIKDALDDLCEKIEDAADGCGYAIPEYVPLMITGGGIALLRGAKEHVSNRTGFPVEVVAPKVPLMEKPTESALLSLLQMAFGQDE